jgi:menaquinone-dependent protoporphyrinogen oxidase
MKSLLVFCSSHGTTEKAVQIIGKYLEGEVETLNLNRSKLQCNVDSFDAVIIGGSIHAGMIQRKVKKFMKDNHDVLMRKQMGLFLCCMYEGEVAKEQFENAFPSELKERAIAKGLFGGELLISQMNFIEKMVIKKVSGTTTETSNLNIQAIMEFAEKFNQELRRTNKL